MKELRLTDAELQALIAPALRAKLRAAGFEAGRPSTIHGYPFFFLPINLDLAGQVSIERSEDGTWMFRQEQNPIVVERTEVAEECHRGAQMQTLIAMEG